MNYPKKSWILLLILLLGSSLLVAQEKPKNNDTKKDKEEEKKVDVKKQKKEAQEYAARANNLVQLSSRYPPQFKNQILLEALKSIDKALSLDPNNDSYHFGKGEILFHLNEFKRAIKSFSKAIELNATQPHYWHYKSYALLRQGKKEDALQLLDDGIRKFNDNPRMLFYLNNYKMALFFDLKDYKKAATSLEETLKYYKHANPDKRKLFELLESHFGTVYLLLSKLDPSEKEKFIKKSNELFKKALTYAKGDKKKEFIIEFNTAVRIMQMCGVDLSILYTKKVKTKHPLNPKIYEFLAELHRRQGHMDKSLLTFKEWLSVYEKNQKEMDASPEKNTYMQAKTKFTGYVKFITEYLKKQKEENEKPEQKNKKESNNEKTN